MGGRPIGRQDFVVVSGMSGRDMDTKLRFADVHLVRAEAVLHLRDGG